MDDIEDALKKSFSIFAEKFIQEFEEHNKDCFFDAFKSHIPPAKPEAWIYEPLEAD